MTRTRYHGRWGIPYIRYSWDAFQWSTFSTKKIWKAEQKIFVFHCCVGLLSSRHETCKLPKISSFLNKPYFYSDTYSSDWAEHRRRNTCRPIESETEGNKETICQRDHNRSSEYIRIDSSEGKTPYWRPKCRREASMTIDLKEIWCEAVDSMRLAL